MNPVKDVFGSAFSPKSKENHKIANDILTAYFKTVRIFLHGYSSRQFHFRHVPWKVSTPLCKTKHNKIKKLD